MRMYYKVGITFINQNYEDFNYIGMDTYRYLLLKGSVYETQKGKVPAIILTLVIFGYGFTFCTHCKK